MASLYTPDDVHRLIYGQIAPIASTGGDEPQTMNVSRKPGITPDPLNVPVWFFSTEMRHSVPRRYPMVVLQPLDIRTWVEAPTQGVFESIPTFGDNLNLNYRSSPTWFEYTYQLTCAAKNLVDINELEWALMWRTFSYDFGIRHITDPLGIERPIYLSARNLVYQREDGIYRYDMDLSVRLPTYTTDPVAAQYVDPAGIGINVHEISSEPMSPSWPSANPVTETIPWSEIPTKVNLSGSWAADGLISGTGHLVNGNSVSPWPDASTPNEPFIQDAASSQPVLVAPAQGQPTNGLNGLPIVRFSSTVNQSMAAAVINYAQPFDIFIVVRPLAAPSSGIAILSSPTFSLTYTANQRFACSLGLSAGAQPFIGVGEWHLLSLHFNGNADSYLRFDGGQQFALTPGVVTGGTPFTLGSGSQPSPMEVAEVRYCAPSLSAGSRIRTERSMITKWGLGTI